MKVPIGLFVFWAVCVIGIIIGFGNMNDAFTMAGYHVWKIIGIVCSILAAAGFLWLYIKSR